jgi:hypothetical protein
VQVNFIGHLVPTVEIVGMAYFTHVNCLLLLFREILRGFNNKWANLVDIASLQGVNPLTVKPGSIQKQGSYVNSLSKHYCLQNQC